MLAAAPMKKKAANNPAATGKETGIFDLTDSEVSVKRSIILPSVKGTDNVTIEDITNCWLERYRRGGRGCQSSRSVRVECEAGRDGVTY
jgi:hypothetical protein